MMEKKKKNLPYLARRKPFPIDESIRQLLYKWFVFSFAQMRL